MFLSSCGAASCCPAFTSLVTSLTAGVWSSPLAVAFSLAKHTVSANNARIAADGRAAAFCSRGWWSICDYYGCLWPSVPKSTFLRASLLNTIRIAAGKSKSLLVALGNSTAARQFPSPGLRFPRVSAGTVAPATGMVAMADQTRSSGNAGGRSDDDLGAFERAKSFLLSHKPNRLPVPCRLPKALRHRRFPLSLCLTPPTLQTLPNSTSGDSVPSAADQVACTNPFSNFHHLASMVNTL